ncbi:hypothetical protein ACTXM3_08600 [Glutamicibacter arilaitensis]|uniref:hypothetical protein n=1 Tax=Glutamicibacter arilaitensis TaxID=256701 RepID=UPI003FD06A8F
MSQHLEETREQAIEVKLSNRGNITNMMEILAGFADGITVKIVFGPDGPLVREQIANKLRALKEVIDSAYYGDGRYLRWVKCYRAGVWHLQYGYGWTYWFLPKI